MRLGMLTTLLRVPCGCELPDVPASETLPRVAGLAPNRSCPIRSCRMPLERSPFRLLTQGYVRCSGRPHGRTPAEGRRPTRLRHGVQPPIKRTRSLPLSTSGVITHVPPQAAVTIFPAVSVPTNGNANPLATAPRTQKLILNGAYKSVVNTLPAPYATYCAADSAASAWTARIVDANSTIPSANPRILGMSRPPQALSYPAPRPRVKAMPQHRVWGEVAAFARNGTLGRKPRPHGGLSELIAVPGFGLKCRSWRRRRLSTY